MQESGQLDNTIIVVISDNGASGEAVLNGSVNEVEFFNGYIDTVEDGLKLMDNLGGPETYNHYPIGWAMGIEDTPYKLFKRYASHEGGIAGTAIISWPKGIAAHGKCGATTSTSATSPRQRTTCSGSPRPPPSRAFRRSRWNGVSFKVVLDDPAAPTGKETQFYMMLAPAASGTGGGSPTPSTPLQSAGWSNFDKDRWELFHIEADRSQCHYLAADNPDKLEELKASRSSEAAKYNGLPLADLEHHRDHDPVAALIRPAPGSRTDVPGTADVGMGAAVEIQGLVIRGHRRGDDRHDGRRGRVVQTRWRARRAR